ncbi:hypothetical protein OsI_19577 [Oryza sativa Indica Group]|uniref:Uncharacterized protein n=1 Tax=Oryza sativa subsp. indica TaxID=39946 RepID=A2Y3J5_ORYSI|nr:hypothetical protein OsI_19577 [Oryza sativa Indica Group]
MVSRVADEDARQGSRAELVRRCRDGVGVAEAAEHAKMIVRRGSAEQQLVRREGARGAAWPSVDQMRRRLQGFSPKRQRSSAVNKHCAHAVIDRPEDTFRLAILLRGIGAGEAKNSSVERQE